MLSPVAKAKTPSKTSKQPSKPSEGAGLTQINLRLPGELLAAVDAAVDAANAADPWHRVNRSDFIREAIVAELLKRGSDGRSDAE